MIGYIYFHRLAKLVIVVAPSTPEWIKSAYRGHHPVLYIAIQITQKKIVQLCAIFDLTPVYGEFANHHLSTAWEVVLMLMTARWLYDDKIS